MLIWPFVRPGPQLQKVQEDDIDNGKVALFNTPEFEKLNILHARLYPNTRHVYDHVAAKSWHPLRRSRSRFETWPRHFGQVHAVAMQLGRMAAWTLVLVAV